MSRPAGIHSFLSSIGADSKRPIAIVDRYSMRRMGFPAFPPTKEGGDEQDKMTDDLGLSASWVAASAAFARLARLNGHAPEAEEAMRAE